MEVFKVWIFLVLNFKLYLVIIDYKIIKRKVLKENLYLRK